MQGISDEMEDRGIFQIQKAELWFWKFESASLKSIRNLDLLLTIAIEYVAEISGKSENIRLRAEIIEVSKRLFSIPNFVYYAVADGIFEALKAVKSDIKRFFFLPDNDGQLSLFSYCEISRLNFGES